MPLGIMMSRECVFDELEIPEDWHRLLHDTDFAVESSKSYNDIAERIVGRRLLSETKPDPDRQWPAFKGLHDVFEARNVWHNESYWLMQSADTPDELEALLDRVEKRLENARGFLLPDNWDREKERLLALNVKPPLYRNQRGPITFAMSVYGVENLVFLLYDRPELAERFRNLILKSMLAIKSVLDEEAGFTPETAPRGFGFADDNCAMLNRELYEFFGYPILKGIFDCCSPDPSDRRYQHSDSDMGHLLPVLGKLDLTGVNFGPNLTVTEIREHLPNAVIHGQLAPFTFSRNEEVNMVAELLRDFEMAREKRGILFTTAGSINNGSRLSGMRLLMAAIQEFCQY
jgi:uroporphyrinogen decarboxylase